MTEKEKAVAYDKIIAKAKKMHDENIDACKACIEELIPELEREDEKIRKYLIKCISKMTPQSIAENAGLKQDNIIAYLEKKRYSEHELENEYWRGYDDAKCHLEKQGDEQEIFETAKRQGYKEGLRDGRAEVWKQIEKQGEHHPIKKVEAITNDSMTEFQKQVSYLIASVMNKEYKYTQGYVEWVAQELLGFAQHEQKLADKVEPRFNVGDWVMLDRPVLITKVEDMPYNTHQYWTSDGTWFGDGTKAKLWAIEDAKDGDVLCCESGWTCIFRALNSDISFSSYCFMDDTGWFCETGSESHTLDKAFIKAYNGNIHPATKEQRDLLFSKMHEAGYQWDAEKKELKKVEQNPTEDGDLPEFESYLCLMFQKFRTKGMCTNGEIIDYVKEHSQKLKDILVKPAWSEEDERMHRGLHNLIYSTPYCDSRKELSDWLKSLKDRVQPQSKQGWSEEDEKRTKQICEDLQYGMENRNAQKFIRALHSDGVIKSNINWLKSLRPKWKPSEEQIKALDVAVNMGSLSLSDMKNLSALRKDLKVL